MIYFIVLLMLPYFSYLPPCILFIVFTFLLVVFTQSPKKLKKTFIHNYLINSNLMIFFKKTLKKKFQKNLEYKKKHLLLQPLLRET